jgi:hypothetical protein
MFVTVYLQTIFHTKCVRVFMIYLHIKVRTSSSNGSLAINNKPKDKNIFAMEATLLFYTNTLCPVYR